MSTISRFRSRHQTLPLDGGTPSADPPSTPTNLEVTGQAMDSIALAWTPSWLADFYEVRYGPSGGPYTDFPTPTSDTTLIVTGLDPDTDYCFEVRAGNANGESAWTTEVCGTTAFPCGVIGESQIGHAVICD
jgi:hypothetical protein